MNKGHILFIVENNPAPPDVRVWNEARAARDFGYEVSVIGPRDRKDDPFHSLIEGVHVYRHPRPKEASGKRAMLLEYLNAPFWEMIISAVIFLARPFRVIHGANPPDHLFMIALPFKPFGVKYLFDHHDIAPENYVAKFGRRDLLFRFLRIMERLTFRTADLVVSTNESYKRIAMERGGKRDEEVVVVRNGPDLERLPDVSPNPELRRGFRHLVAYVGLMGQQEGIENLLRAAEHIVKTRGRDDVGFIVVGTGPYLGHLKRRSADMGLEGSVRFTGYIPNRDKYEVLATADVCVNPEFGNAFTDKSTMIKIMEYMSVGKPVVQFHTTEGEVTAGPAAVYVRENDVVRFAEAILDLLGDDERRAAMGAAGRERVETRWAWGIQKRRLKDAYGRILGPGDPPAGARRGSPG